MTDYLPNQTAYLIGGNVILSDTLETYIERFITDFVGRRDAKFVSLELNDYHNAIWVNYEIPNESCGDCEEQELTGGICEHECVEQIDYKLIDVYL